MPTKEEIKANAAKLIDRFETPRMQTSMTALESGQSTPVTRNTSKEKAVADKMGLSPTQLIQLEQNPIYKKKLFEMAYGDTVGALPEYQDLLKQEANLKAKGEEATGTMPSATKMRVLEEALRSKNDIGRQQLGQSDLFKAAGVTGYGALSQNLAQRGLEMQDRYGSFVNQLGKVGEYLSDTHNVVASQYKMLADEYNKQAEQMNGIMDNIAQHEQAMDYMERQYALNKDLAEFKAGLDGSDGGGGYTNTKTALDDYNFDNYALDSGWKTAITGYLRGMPEFTQTENMSGDIDGYIETEIQNSPITGDMVVKAAEKYDVPPQLVLAIAQHESQLGTSNVANNNNNVAGMTWTGKNGEKGTARPSKEGGYYVKYNNMQDSLNALARNIAGRKKSNTANPLAQTLVDKVNAGTMTIEQAREQLKSITTTGDARAKAINYFENNIDQSINDKEVVKDILSDDATMKNLAKTYNNGWFGAALSNEEMIKKIKAAILAEKDLSLTDAQATILLEEAKNL